MSASRLVRLLRDPIASACWVLAVILLLLYGSNFTGPASGWIDRLLAQPEETLVAPDDPLALPSLGEDEPLSPLDDLEPVEPEPLTTPDAVRPALEAFTLWLNSQQEKLQGQAFTRVRADREGRSLILHVTVTEPFLQLPIDTQEQIGQTLALQWALQAESHQLVRSRSRAGIAIYAPDGRRIGGGPALPIGTIEIDPRQGL